MRLSLSSSRSDNEGNKSLVTLTGVETAMLLGSYNTTVTCIAAPQKPKWFHGFVHEGLWIYD